MNPSAIESPGSWTTRRLVSAGALVFLAQVVLILVFGERGGERRPQDHPFRISAAQPGWIAPLVSTGWEDPALFALASRQGFSGQAWLALPQVGHAFHEWTAEPFWLGPKLETLGAAFVQYVQQQTGLRDAAIEKTAPAIFLTDATGTEDYWPQQSRLVLSGGLEARALISTPAPPSWPHADLLKPTGLQLVVNADGLVTDVLVLSESGSKSADEEALRQGRRLRFAPLAGNPNSFQLQIGRAALHWHTLAPGKNATNSVLSPR